MSGIKIPLHDFALKMQGGGGGLCARGGVFAGHYGISLDIPEKNSFSRIEALRNILNSLLVSAPFGYHLVVER